MTDISGSSLSLLLPVYMYACVPFFFPRLFPLIFFNPFFLLLLFPINVCYFISLCNSFLPYIPSLFFFFLASIELVDIHFR